MGSIDLVALPLDLILIFKLLTMRADKIERSGPCKCEKWG